MPEPPGEPATELIFLDLPTVPFPNLAPLRADRTRPYYRAVADTQPLPRIDPEQFTTYGRDFP
nr:hypothetical protein [Kibdelosporangium sp. MJ126-NF4]CEL16575.1 hypothetical protein [Kibdelosporangium sp. MJ126-NF4]CTQ89074.1 hypothetical protein [Kibdelosporangium sp. MJ126-NF4]